MSELYVQRPSASATRSTTIAVHTMTTALGVRLDPFTADVSDAVLDDLRDACAIRAGGLCGKRQRHVRQIELGC